MGDVDCAEMNSDTLSALALKDHLEDTPTIDTTFSVEIPGVVLWILPRRLVHVWQTGSYVVFHTCFASNLKGANTPIDLCLFAKRKAIRVHIASIHAFECRTKGCDVWGVSFALSRLESSLAASEVLLRMRTLTEEVTSLS